MHLRRVVHLLWKELRCHHGLVEGGWKRLLLLHLELLVLVLFLHLVLMLVLVLVLVLDLRLVSDFELGTALLVVSSASVHATVPPVLDSIVAASM